MLNIHIVIKHPPLLHIVRYFWYPRPHGYTFDTNSSTGQPPCAHGQHLMKNYKINGAYEALRQSFVVTMLKEIVNVTRRDVVGLVGGCESGQLMELIEWESEPKILP